MRWTYGLKENAEISFQELRLNNSFEWNKKQYKLDDLERVEVFTENGVYNLNNVKQKLPESKVFTKKKADEKLLVSYNADNKLNSIIIYSGRRSETLAELYARDKYLVTITDDMIDYNAMEKKFILAEGVSDHADDEIGEGILENVEDVVWPFRLNMNEPCADYQVVEVSVDFETSFCDHHGGPDQAVEAFAGIMAATSIKYQQQGLCRKILVSRLDGYCDIDSDPYAKQVEQNLSGCAGYGLLTYFGEYYNVTHTYVDRDASLLLSGTGLECETESRCIVGCANIGTLCRKETAYGVTYATFSNSLNFRSILVAHELGHVSGANHKLFGSGEYIMAPTIKSFATGFSSKSIRKMNCYLEESTCPARLQSKKKTKLSDLLST